MYIPTGFLLGLWCFVHFAAEIHAECSNLKIFDGSREITSDVNCILLPTKDCQNGPTSFPEGLGVGLSVEKPDNFTVNSLLDTSPGPNGNLFLVSRLQMSWKGPSSGMGRQGLKGFYLKMSPVGSGALKCRLLNLLNNNFTENTNLRFQFEMFPVTDDATFVVDMFSLPPPSDAEVASGLYGRNIISFPGNKDLNSSGPAYPKDWNTTISAIQHKEDGVIEVKFALPLVGSSAHFDKYRVALFKADGTSFKDLQIYYVPAKGQGGFAVYNFTNVPDGTYYIQVMPNDSFYNDDEKCQCYGPDTNGLLDKVCGTCSFTQTSVFNVTGMPPPTSTSTRSTLPVTIPAHPPTSANSSTGMQLQSTTGQQESTSNSPQIREAGLNDGEIAAAVVVPVALLAALAVLLLKCGLRNNDNNNNQKDNMNEYSPSAISVIQPGKENNQLYKHLVQPFTDICHSFKQKTETCVPTLTRKHVFLLSAEDHSYFKQAVEKFADFLTLHCQCEVTCAFSQMASLRKTNCYPWLSGNIDKSDFVIIVNSEAAYHLYTAYQTGQAYENAQFSPYGDLFTVGIMHICGKFTLGQDVSNVIIVNFEHTSRDYRLPLDALPIRHYLLPNNLKPFLLHMHGLDNNTMDLSKVNLPLQGNIPELRGGSDWLRAVKECHSYEQHNPNWFATTYGEPTVNTKPELIKQGSCDSGYPTSRPPSDTMDRIRRQLSSVSMQGPDSPEEAYFKEHCVEPSTTGLSAYTVPYSAFMPSPRPPEIDKSSTISEQFRQVNDDYERQCSSGVQDQVYNKLWSPPLPLAPPAVMLAFTDQYDNMPADGEGSFIRQPHGYSYQLDNSAELADGECISVYSAESV